MSELQGASTALHTSCIHEAIIGALGQLLRTEADEMDEVITHVLAQTGDWLQADRAAVMLRTDGLWHCTHEWCANGLAPVRAALQELPLATAGFTPADLLTGRDILLPSVSALPDGPLRRLLQNIGVHSVAALPVLRNGRFLGLMAVARQATPEPLAPAFFPLLRPLVDGLFAASARHRAEAALLQARRAQDEAVERLRATLAATSELVMEVDLQGRCVDIHNARPELLAVPAETMLGQPIEQTMPPDVAALQRAAMHEALENGVSSRCEYPLQTGESTRWFRLAVARRVLPGGEVGFVFRIRDITAEHEPRAQNALLVAVTRQMTNLAAVLDDDLKVRWINPAFEQQSGWTLAEVAGRPVTEVLDPGIDPEATQRIMAAITAREPISIELKKHDRAGTPYWIDLRLQPMQPGADGRGGFIAIETVITERKKYEAALQAMATRFEAANRRLIGAIEALEDGFVLFDEKDRLVLCNTRYRELNRAVADIIRPGVRIQEIVAEGRRRGMYDDPPGKAGACVKALHHSISDERYDDELQYADGRIIRVFAKRMPGGGHVGLRSDITALRQAEQRLADIITGARVGTWELDLDTDLETVNDYWHGMLGYAPGDSPALSGEKWNILAHPEDNARVEAEMARIRQGLDDRLEMEVRLRHRNGHWVHVLTRGRVTERDAAGRARRMSGVDIDVTEWRRAEERLGTIMEATAIATWEYDTAIPFSFIDENYAQMLGYALDDLLPFSMEKFFSLSHPDDLTHLAERARVSHENGVDNLSNEMRLRHRDGHWVWIMCKTRVLRWGPDGTPAAATGINIDITETKEREAALSGAKAALEVALAERHTAEQRLADIASVSEDWFWELDTQNRFTYLSEGAERATGKPASQLIGRSLDELGLTLRTTGDWAGLVKRFVARESFSEFIYRVDSRHRGEPIWLRISGAPFFDAMGRFAGYRGAGTNVTLLMAATRRAEAANEAKSRFLATMSHELRTPLTGVIGMAEILSETGVTSEQRRMIDTIRDSGEGLLAVLNDVLDLAKIEAGKLEIVQRPFSPSRLAGRIEAHYRNRAEAKGLVLRIETGPGCSKQWLADPDRLLQILHNLVGNALKFTSRGEIAVTLSVAGGTLSVTVSDTGIGMSREQLTRVLQPFEQADNRTARRFGGTGLGLSITRRLVDLMAGEITIDSAPNQGTQVRLRLPVQPAASRPVADNPVLPTGGFAGLRVLVADDNATNRLILKRMLEGLEIDVTVCDDGQAALEAFRPGDFDLVMLDIAMPGLDGVAALKGIREREAAAGAPPTRALAVTANAMRHQVEEYLAAGFSGHLAKPFRKARLAEAIAQPFRPESEEPAKPRSKAG